MSALQQEINEAIQPLVAEIKTLYSAVQKLQLQNQDDGLIPLKDAAKILNVCPQTLRRMVHSGKIKCHRPGGTKMYFDRADLI